MSTCILCEQPAVCLVGEYELCEEHAEVVTRPDPLCAECGVPLPAEDIEAGETTCLECAGLAFLVEIEQEGPLLARVRVVLSN